MAHSRPRGADDARAGVSQAVNHSDGPGQIEDVGASHCLMATFVAGTTNRDSRKNDPLVRAFAYQSQRPDRSERRTPAFRPGVQNASAEGAFNTEGLKRRDAADIS